MPLAHRADDVEKLPGRICPRPPRRPRCRVPCGRRLWHVGFVERERVLCPVVEQDLSHARRRRQLVAGEEMLDALDQGIGVRAGICAEADDEVVERPEGHRPDASVDRAATVESNAEIGRLQLADDRVVLSSVQRAACRPIGRGESCAPVRVGAPNRGWKICQAFSFHRGETTIPRGSAVIRYDGKRGTVWRIKYVDTDGRQVMEIGPERENRVAVDA